MGVKVINRISNKSYCNLDNYDLSNSNARSNSNTDCNSKSDSDCNNSTEQTSSGCCTEREILCISIPCPISFFLLGTSLQLELPLFKLTSNQGLTAEQISALLNLGLQELIVFKNRYPKRNIS